MSDVVIGVDPAKRSHAIEVIDDRERTLAAGVFDKDLQQVEDLWPERDRFVFAEQDLFRRVKTEVPKLVNTSRFRLYMGAHGLLSKDSSHSQDFSRKSL